MLVAATVPAHASAQDAIGFHVRDGRLFDGYGNDFVMRGVNHPHSWFDAELGSLVDIKATGANTVRVVLSTGARFKRTESDEIATLVAECRRNRLVCVLEVHDTSGYPGEAGAITLDQAVDYWIDIAAAVRGHESFVLINIGNEPFDNEHTDQWLSATTGAIERLRQADFEHTLIVDAPAWGQDSTFTMRDKAELVANSDPLRNVVFDVHMYGVFDHATKVRSYIEAFVRADLPLIIGEFGATHTDGDPDEAAIMHWAEMYGIGYLGWSWSGNTVPVEDLNVVRNFAPDQRTPWGDLLIDGPRGIGKTSVEASIFGEPRALPRPLLASPPPAQETTAATTNATPLAQTEAEDATRNGLQVSVQGAGFSGAGYLTGFDSRGDSVTMVVHVDHGAHYELGFGYRSPYGDKIQRLTINGEPAGSVTFPQSSSFRAMHHGDVALVPGENHITITHDWGWFDLDNVQIAACSCDASAAETN